MLRLLLVRHAITEANQKQKWLGRRDSPFTMEGKRQVQLLQKVLERYTIDKIYASPSKRTIETIKGLAKSRGLIIEEAEALREINFGDFEEKLFTEVERKNPLEIEKMLQEGTAYRYPNGESLEQSYERLVHWIQPVLEDKAERTLLICAHGGTIRNILSYLLAHNSSLHWHFRIDHASMSIITIEQGFAVCEVLNNRSFLMS